MSNLPADSLPATVPEAERLLKQITPGPWAWEWIAEKSNEWAVGQAFDADGKAIEGRLPNGEWLEDRIIERRLVGMNESGHARAADAEFIAASPRLVRDFLAMLRSSQEEIARLKAGLSESVKLQSHYAELLNMHDGGQRITFMDADEWIERLKGVKR
jgi:hypothetical protein